MEASVYCRSVSPSVCYRMVREEEGDESRCRRGPHTRLFAQRSIDRPHARTQARERALSRSASSLHARAVSSSSFAAPLVRRWCLVCRSLLPSPLFFLSSAPLQQQTNKQTNGFRVWVLFACWVEWFLYILSVCFLFLRSLRNLSLCLRVRVWDFRFGVIFPHLRFLCKGVFFFSWDSDVFTRSKADG